MKLQCLSFPLLFPGSTNQRRMSAVYQVLCNCATPKSALTLATKDKAVWGSFAPLSCLSSPSSPSHTKLADWIGPNYLRLGFAWQGCQGSGHGWVQGCGAPVVRKPWAAKNALLLDQSTLVSKGYYCWWGASKLSSVGKKAWRHQPGRGMATSWNGKGSLSACQNGKS